MEDKSLKYYSFLIRLWKVQQNGLFIWRASLENPLTQEILNFKDLSSLFDYLKNLTVKEEGTD